MKMIESLFDMMRLSDDAPDADYGDLRDGIPVETPQEREVAEGGHGGGQGVAEGWPQGGQGVAKGANRAARGLPWYSKGVPTTELSPLWWAKATRAVRWKWDRAVKQLIWWPCAVITALLAGCGMAPEWIVLVVANAVLFLVMDPFGALGRRLAFQSRLLVALCAVALYVAVNAPSVGTISAFIAILILSAVIIAICNTEWVVTANYISSPTIHAAMANDPTSSAHRSWEGFGSKLAYTYSSEMGYPPTSNFIWAILRGVYIIGWTVGVRKIVTEDEVIEAEMNEKRADLAERQCQQLTWEKDQLRHQLDELEDPELINNLREQIAELQENVCEERHSAAYFRNQMKEAQDTKEKEVFDVVGKYEKDIERMTAAHEKELNALRAEHAAALAALEAKCREDVEAAEKAMLGDSGGLREKLLLSELQRGVTSQKQLSEMTGIPRTTVRRILDKWKVDNMADALQDGAA